MDMYIIFAHLWFTGIWDPVCNTLAKIQDKMMVRAFAQKPLSCNVFAYPFPHSSEPFSSVHHMQIKWVFFFNVCIIRAALFYRDMNITFSLCKSKSIVNLYANLIFILKHWNKMNPVTSVTYYIQFWNIYSFYQNKVISFLMLVNYTTKCIFFGI